jgi:hypothetical protein
MYIPQKRGEAQRKNIIFIIVCCRLSVNFVSMLLRMLTPVPL